MAGSFKGTSLVGAEKSLVVTAGMTGSFKGSEMQINVY